MAQITQVTDNFALYSEQYVEKGRAEGFWNKEPDTRAWIEECLQDGDVFWDIGACIGQFALYEATLYKDMEIYAIEPYWPNYLRMCQNITLNEQTASILPLHLALWDEDLGRTKLFVRDLRLGGSGNQIGWPPMTEKGKPFQPKGYVWTLAVTLDSLVYKLGCGCPNHIKIDVDGTEFRVIRGMARALGDTRLRSLLVEKNGGRPGNEHMLEHIEGCGFTRDNPWNSNGSGNAIFVRR